ncbi:MAG: hypothetical protein ABSG04_01160 [Verrucomicrobiota bacterium]
MFSARPANLFCQPPHVAVAVGSIPSPVKILKACGDLALQGRQMPLLE